ncbi:MAG: amidohydrolase family protein, partial [Muribaculaceae bacterium]|nr:amidohydrolase family protein [Muribaculaceae bacterium]
MILIHNARLVNRGKVTAGWLVIDGEFISASGKGTPPSMEADVVIDAEGALLMPGAIDDHVHFRDPGLTRKGDIATESAVAMAGGVTSFMDMPNTVPPTVTIEAWQQKMERAAEVSRANYAFFIGATNDNTDELLRADYTRVPGVKLFLGSSTGNMLVDSDSALDRLFSQVHALIAVHAEDNDRIAANTAMARDCFGSEPVPVEMHPLIRDARACFDASLRAIELARRHNARLHLLHVSTAAEVRLLSRLDRPEGVTAEPCIQYLEWCDKDYAEMGTRLKCNPAVKASTDRSALRRAVKDGVIDVIGTDHAPHLLSEKEGDALTAPSGCPNLQFSLPMLLDLFTPQIVAERTAHAPARIFGIDRRGYLDPGCYADMVIVAQEPHTISDADAIGRCGWIPAAGHTTGHTVVATIVNGTVA